jgi:acetylornithine deacetylase/succinyl-diaminopimelate desuccinylase-like protein
MVSLDSLLGRVSAERLRELTMALVRIPSPTGDARQVTAYYVDCVRSLGLPIEVVDTYPDSPSTVARYIHRPGGRTLTLDGHLDTIHAAHVPPYVEGKRLYGRGAGDMKSGVAAMLEATRVLVEADVPLAGGLILATHSLHEAPVGHMEGLKELIARGDVFVDAALVAECGFDALPIRGKGQALFEIETERRGEVLHENVARREGACNPLEYVARLAARMMARHDEMTATSDPYLGSETFFLGQIHSGDFYNRVPTRAFLNGTHRYWPDKSWAHVEQLFEELVASVERPSGLDVRCRLLSNGLGYAVPEDAPIVQALQAGYRSVVGRELPLEGALSVCDVNVIVREAGIPAVAHGTGSTTAHGDLEWVDLDDAARTARVFIAAIVAYLGVGK